MGQYQAPVARGGLSQTPTYPTHKLVSGMNLQNKLLPKDNPPPPPESD